MVTGALIIIISYTLEPLFSCLLRTRGYKHYTFLEWSTNETLQIQRLAYQGLDCESCKWSGYTDAVPTTQPPGEMLGNLSLAYAIQQEKDMDGAEKGWKYSVKNIGNLKE